MMDGGMLRLIAAQLAKDDVEASKRLREKLDRQDRQVIIGIAVLGGLGVLLVLLLSVLP